MGVELAKRPVVITGSAIMTVVVLPVFDGIASLPTAPGPGDPFYPAWLSTIDAVSIVIPMLVVGAPTVALVLLAIQGNGFSGR